MYFLSAAESRKRLRNFDLPSLRNAASNVRLPDMGFVISSSTIRLFFSTYTQRLVRRSPSNHCGRIIPYYGVSRQIRYTSNHPQLTRSGGVAERFRGACPHRLTVASWGVSPQISTPPPLGKNAQPVGGMRPSRRGGCSAPSGHGIGPVAALCAAAAHATRRYYSGFMGSVPMDFPRRPHDS